MIETTTKQKSVSKKPSQARSMATFANILNAATQIIVERGIQGLNTNIVAERAGINIGTVYHYFPDKTAILVELYRIDQVQRSAFLLGKLRELPCSPDLTTWTKEFFELVQRLRRVHPTAAALHRAFLSVPELVAMDQLDTASTTAFLSGLLQGRFASLDAERAHCASRLLVETTMSIMDCDLADDAETIAFFDEALSLINNYLENIEG